MSSFSLLLLKQFAAQLQLFGRGRNLVLMVKQSTGAQCESIRADAENNTITVKDIFLCGFRSKSQSLLTVSNVVLGSTS